MMQEKLKKIMMKWNIWVLIFCLLMAIFAINPSFDTSGVSITYIDKNSSAYNAGIPVPSEKSSPRSKEIITHINNQRIITLSDYETALSSIYSKLYTEGDIVSIQTKSNKNGYLLQLQPIYTTEVLPELENISVNVTKEIYDSNSSKYVNKTVQETVLQNKTKLVFVGIKDIGIRVKQAPFSNIRKGLDLEGGTRVLLQPEKQITDEEFDNVISNMKQRLNVYGLSDIIVRESKDLAGQRYVVVEIAGVNQEEVRNLIAKQGKFEAKVGNTTVFAGGGDIKIVMKTSPQAGLDPQRCPLQVSADLYTCRYFFGIVLSQEAAEKQSVATSKLNVLTVDELGNPLQRENYYLDQKVDFYLDDKLTDSLNIGADLKGRAVTDIQISGSGQGMTQQEAAQVAQQEMKRMQTILITGSLPVKMNIVKTDSLSPVLGKEFLKNALLLAFIGIIAVMLLIGLVYRRTVILIPILITMISEILLILGFAAAAGWNLDLLSIAGIIIVIGTGADHLIIITDETLKKSSEQLNWLQKIKRAFKIILIAGFTNIFAMIPLMTAGAGILKGFALTSIIGVVIGIFIARPAYSAMIEILLKD